MKKFIVSSSLTNRARDWFASNEVEELVKGCKPEEKRLVGRIMQSTDPKVYVEGIADTSDILNADTSENFDIIISKCIELF